MQIVNFCAIKVYHTVYQKRSSIILLKSNGIFKNSELPVKLEFVLFFIVEKNL